MNVVGVQGVKFQAEIQSCTFGGNDVVRDNIVTKFSRHKAFGFEYSSKASVAASLIFLMLSLGLDRVQKGPEFVRKCRDINRAESPMSFRLMGLSIDSWRGRT